MLPGHGNVVLIDAMTGFLHPDRQVMRGKVESACIGFVVVGIARGLARTLQFFFGFSKVRVSLLKKIFEIKIGLHDDPANPPGKLFEALEHVHLVFDRRDRRRCHGVQDTHQGSFNADWLTH